MVSLLIKTFIKSQNGDTFLSIRASRLTPLDLASTIEMLMKKQIL